MAGDKYSRYLQKAILRQLFKDYDEATKKLIDTAAAIKAEAPAYWRSQGYSVFPRLERLRADVFKED